MFSLPIHSMKIMWDGLTLICVRNFVYVFGYLRYICTPIIFYEKDKILLEFAQLVKTIGDIHAPFTRVAQTGPTLNKNKK